MITFGIAWWLLAILVIYAISITALVIIYLTERGSLIADDETSKVLDEMDIEQRIREGRQP